MKATVDSKLLGAALGRVLPFRARFGLSPQLTCVLIEATDGTLRLTATDLEHSATTTVDAEVHDPGTLLAPGQVLGSALKALVGPAELTHDGTDLSLDAGTVSLTIRTGDADQFPRLAWPTADTPLEECWADIAAVAVAASADDQRLVLRSVVFADGCASATDSFRLHWSDAPDEITGIIPAEAITRAARVLGDTVSMGTDERTAVLTDGTTTISTRLIVAEPPNWRRLVDLPKPHELAFDSAELLAALAAVTAIEGEDTSRSVHLALDGDRLLISRTNKDVGSAATSIAAEGTWHEPYLRLNATFLTQAVTATGGERTVIRAADDAAAVIINGERVSAFVQPVNTRRAGR